jgi:hypothetical protein
MRSQQPHPDPEEERDLRIDAAYDKVRDADGEV